jgi:hypothetical protein
LVALAPASFLDDASEDQLDPDLIPLVERIGGIPLVGLSEIRLTVYPFDSLRLDIGRFSHGPGLAVFGSPNNYFGSLGSGVVTDLLTGDWAAAALTPAELIVVTGFLRDSFGRVTIAPAPTTPTLPALPGTWFPDVGIPVEISVPELSPNPISLDDISIEATSRLEAGYARVSASAEIGITLPFVSGAVLYYHGIDTSPVLRSRLDFSGGDPPTRYDLEIDPYEAVIDAIGVIAEGGAGPLTFWFDGAITLNKQMATTEIDSATRRTIVTTAPRLAANAGASVQLSRIRMLAEYAFTHAFSEADLIELSVPHLLIAGARLYSGPGALWTGLGTAVSLADLSAGFLWTAAFTPSDEFEVAASVPLLLGGQQSFIGQYSDVYAAQIGLTYRF